MIITIDGPAGSGKSAAALELARRLGVPHLDTGAMYRAVALDAMEQKILDDPDRIGHRCRLEAPRFGRCCHRPLIHRLRSDARLLAGRRRLLLLGPRSLAAIVGRRRRNQRMQMLGPLAAVPPSQLRRVMWVGVPVRGRSGTHVCDGSRDAVGLFGRGPKPIAGVRRVHRS